MFSENIYTAVCPTDYAVVTGIVREMVTVPVVESAVFVMVRVMVAVPVADAVGSLVIVNVASVAFDAVNPSASLLLSVTAVSIAVFIAAALEILPSLLCVPSHVIAGTAEPVSLSTSA